MKFDKLFFTVLFGITIPLFCFVVFWWGTFLITKEENIIKISALAGLGLGIIITLLIKVIRKPDFYQLSVPVLILVYLFYNALLFGMFMGVPFFHLILGVIAGYYWANYLKLHRIKDQKREILRISVFCSAFMAGICFSSAGIALLNKSTASELQNMFRLPFEITHSILIVSLVTGGILMIIIQYILVKFTMDRTLQKSI